MTETYESVDEGGLCDCGKEGRVHPNQHDNECPYPMSLSARQTIVAIQEDEDMDIAIGDIFEKLTKIPDSIRSES